MGNFLRGEGKFQGGGWATSVPFPGRPLAGKKVQREEEIGKN